MLDFISLKTFQKLFLYGLYLRKKDRVIDILTCFFIEIKKKIVIFELKILKSFIICSFYLQIPLYYIFMSQSYSISIGFFCLWLILWLSFNVSEIFSKSYKLIKHLIKVILVI